MSQTSYTQRLTAGIPGELSCPLQEAILVTENAALSLPAGILVTRDAADGSIKVPAAAGDVTNTFVGFTKKDVATERQASQTLDYPAKANVTVMRVGRMFVLSETAVTFGDKVYARITAHGGNTQLGKVRNDVDTVSSVDTATLVPNCRFIRTTTAAGLTEIELLA